MTCDGCARALLGVQAKEIHVCGSDDAAQVVGWYGE